MGKIDYIASIDGGVLPGVLVGITLNPMVKNIFLRRRPYFDHSGIQCLKPVERGADIYDISAQGYSFPSGHSTNGVTLYTSLGRYKKNRVLMIIGIIITPIITLIAPAKDKDRQDQIFSCYKKTHLVSSKHSIDED